MPFVKVDCGILDSSVWMPRDLRSLFLTALFMAKPHELKEPTPQIQVRTLEPTGWTVPPGEYGLIEAAATRIIERDGMDLDRGMPLLEQLGEPDHDSKNPDHDGRRVVRVRGGYIVLNFRLYRDKDYTAAARQKRHRDRKREAAGVTDPSRDNGVTSRDVTQAEAEAEAEVKAIKTLAVSSADDPHISTGISTWNVPGAGTLELTRMLNRGMGDNPQIGEVYNPVLATAGHTLTACEQLKEHGVDLGFAETWVYTFAAAYKPKKAGDQIRSLTYLVPAIIEQWDALLAKTDASRAERPPEPRSDPQSTTSTTPRSSNNGTRGARDRGVLIFGELQQAVREVNVLNDPSDPGAGNRLERQIPTEILEALDEPAKRALESIGGPRAIAYAAKDRTESMAWRFGAAYQAAANG